MTSLSKSQTSLLSYSNLVHAIAGASGSAVAMSTFYPLDTVRTRLQLEDSRKSRSTFSVMADVHKEEGLVGLYRGILPVIESLFCSNFVYFFTFHGLKRAGNAEKSALKDLMFGMLAGCVNVMLTNPLWVVNTRIKMQGVKLKDATQPTQTYSGILDGLRKIGRDEGLKGLWSGCLSSLVLVINPAIQFMAYEAMKRHLEKVYGAKNIGTLPVFLAGAIAKAVATVLTYPVQLVQAKQRHGHNYEGVRKNAGMLSLLMYILRLHGPRGLFKGLEAKILQTVCTAAFMFVVYEKITSVVFTIMIGKKSTMAVRH